MSVKEAIRLSVSMGRGKNTLSYIFNLGPTKNTLLRARGDEVVEVTSLSWLPNFNANQMLCFVPAERSSDKPLYFLLDTRRGVVQLLTPQALPDAALSASAANQVDEKLGSAGSRRR